MIPYGKMTPQERRGEYERVSGEFEDLKARGSS